MFALHGFMLGSGAQNSNFKMQDMSYTVLSQNQNVKNTQTAERRHR